MGSASANATLFYGSLIIIVFLLIWFGAKKDSKKLKKKLKKTEEYITGERNRLLQEKYQGFTYKYDYSGDLKKEEGTHYKNYSFILDKNIDKYEVKVVNRIIGEKVSDIDGNCGGKASGDGTGSNSKHYEYHNDYQINITKINYSLFPQLGEFYVSFGTKNLVKSLQNFGNLFASKQTVSEKESKRTSDSVVIGNIGRILYKNITVDEWNKFTSTGVLSEMEKLLLIWQNMYQTKDIHAASLSKCALEYKDGELRFSLSEWNYKNAHRDGYRCIEQDFLIEYSEYFIQTVNQLCEIAKLL